MNSQREHLAKTIEWARRIRAELQPLLDAHGDRVHFRPSSEGVALVGLLPKRPQRGRSGVRNLAALAASFEAEFKEHCLDVEHGRPTPEKGLQSFLIRSAQVRHRKLEPINAASRGTSSPVELLFITDELALPDGNGGKVVCDLLALRVDGGRATPAAIELKSAREMTRLIEQVTEYAAAVDAHADLFAELFGALLGRSVVFDAPCEKWIVWPQAGASRDPREAELGTKGIRVVGYVPSGDDFVMRVGEAP